MATFKPIIFKDRRRDDGLWAVFIRMTHERKVRYIPTSMHVEKKDITSTYRIKNRIVLDRCEEIIRKYRSITESLALELSSMDADSLVALIRGQSSAASGIDFIAFARKWCSSHPEIKGMRNYVSALNSFCSYMGRECVLVREMTPRTMKGFEEHLSDRPRAQSLYTSSIVRIFNEARMHYNDEENGTIRIKDTLKRYSPPKEKPCPSRSLSTDDIRRIFALPYIGRTRSGAPCRRDLALDCFRLSFCLMGMNSADLYEADEFDGERITYFRAKTRDRRHDRAKMSVRVHPLIRPLVEKYRGRERVFSFSERYASMADLNRAINVGLKEVGREIGIDGLQLYAARHSMATIAANEAGIDRWTVNLMLNHTDQSLRVTERYILRDFNPINEANFRLIEYVFGALGAGI